jgi:RNA polymerase sigma-70 factor (ECF subfamily)
MKQDTFISDFNSLTPSLNNFALKLTRNIEDARDLYQETAYKAITNQDKFTQGTNLKAWLFTIMRNIFINAKRKLSSKMTFVDPTDNLFYLNSSKVEMNKGESNLTMKEIEQMLGTLSDNIRTPFMMHFQGFKYYEIADTLNLPLGTIKSRIHFARKMLKRAVEARFGKDFRTSRKTA